MTSGFKHIALGILCLLSCLAGKSQEIIPAPSLITGELDNGLTYYIYPNKLPKGEAVYRLFIKSGSVYETDEQKGLAHFLEHMAFNGTENFPSNTMIRFLESKGAKFGKDLNAHTSYNETVYKLQLPSSDKAVVDSTMTILADWAGRLLLDSLEIEKERGVIMSEWLSKTGPEQDAQNTLLNELLNNSRYSERIVIGDTAVIKNFKHQELRDYYNKWYNPSLMAVAVAGDVDPAEMEKMIIDKFSYLKPAFSRYDIPYYAIAPYDSMAMTVVTHESLKKIELVAVQILPRMSGVASEQDYIPYLQRAILNRLFKSRFSELSFEYPPYKNASIGISDFLNTSGLLLSSVELTSCKIAEGIDSYLNNVEQIYRYGFLPLEIEKVKTDYLTSLQRRVESGSPVMSAMLMEEIYGDFFKGHTITSPEEEYRLAEKYIDRIDSVSLVAYLHETADWNKTHFVISSFDKAAEELPSEDAFISTVKELPERDIARYSKDIIVPDALLSIKPKPGRITRCKRIKEIEAYKMELSNGATVIFKQTDLDKNKMTVTGFRKGGLYALDSTMYVNGLYAGSIVSMSGAGDYSREALSHYMTGSAVSLRFLIDKTRSGIAGSASKEDTEKFFEYLYLKWTQPRLDTAIFRETKERAIESFLTSNVTESEKFQRELSYLLQGRNYTNRELTDVVLRDELSSEYMLDIFDRSFGSAGGFTFVIIGDITLKELKPFIKSYLASLPAGINDTEYKFRREHIQLNDEDFERRTGETPRAVVNLVFQQYETGNMQTENLCNEILKSVLRTKLLKSLREEMGMVYSVGVSASSTIHPSPLSRQAISFSTAPENVDLLIGRTYELLSEMVADPASFEPELVDVKENLKKDFKLDLQRNSFWSSYIRNTIFNGEDDWSYIRDFETLIDSVSAEDIAGMISEKMTENNSRVKAVLYPANN